MNFFPDFAPNSRKEWRLLLFQSNLWKQVRKLPKILKFLRIIHYYSKLFTGVLRPASMKPSTSSCSRTSSPPRGSTSSRTGRRSWPWSRPRRSTSTLIQWVTLGLAKLAKLANLQNLQIFGGLVLGCIKTKFCNKICVWQHFSSSTRFASFCTAAISKFSQKIGLTNQQFLWKFCKQFASVAKFAKFCQISKISAW